MRIRGTSSEGIDRMLWLLNRDFVKGLYRKGSAKYTKT
jgi:hypothetical protein